MTNALFNEQNAQVEEVDQIQIPENDPLSPFRAKYHDDAGIAKSLVEKDSFISRLQKEQAELRAELAARDKVDAVVDRLLADKNKPAPAPQVDNQNPQVAQPDNSQQQQKYLTETDLQKLLEKERITAKEQANKEWLRKELETQVGPKWLDAAQKAAKELGETMDFFEALSARNPSAALKLISSAAGKPAQQQNPSLFTANPSLNSNALAAGQGNLPAGSRGKSFYDNLKKSNATEYWSPKIQQQMHKDAVKLGWEVFNSN